MVGAIGRGFGGSVSYRYYPLGILITPVPHPRSLEYFLIFWRTLRFSVALVTVYISEEFRLRAVH